MKRFLTVLNLSVLVAVAAPAAAFGQGKVEDDPAYLAVDKAIDLKAIPPQVNLNLPRFLIKDAISGLSAVAEDPSARGGVNINDLTKDVKLIRLVIVEAGESNRSDFHKGISALRRTLDSRWTSIATLPDEKIGIYAMEDASGEGMGGLAVLIQDGGKAIIGNIVGRVSLGQLVQFAARFDSFPKELLAGLAQASPSTGAAKSGAATSEATPPKSKE